MKQQPLINHYMNYQTIQVFIKWEGKEGVGVSLYIHQSIEFKIRNDLNIYSDDLEPISVEILFENSKNTIFHVLRRQSKGWIEPFEKF